MGAQKTVMAVSSSDLLPVGFRFKPTDEELVTHYLMNKASSRRVPVADAIQEIDATQFYSHHPKNLVTFSNGEREWFFFIHEDDAQRRRNVREVGDGVGFWKLNGSENPIYNEDGDIFATKIFLTYFSGSCQSNKPKRTHYKNGGIPFTDTKRMGGAWTNTNRSGLHWFLRHIEGLIY